MVNHLLHHELKGHPSNFELFILLYGSYPLAMGMEQEETAWLKLVEANLAHQGHDAKQQGSPITEIVLVCRNKDLKKIWNELRPENPIP